MPQAEVDLRIVRHFGRVLARGRMGVLVATFLLFTVQPLISGL